MESGLLEPAGWGRVSVSRETLNLGASGQRTPGGAYRARILPDLRICDGGVERKEPHVWLKRSGC